MEAAAQLMRTGTCNTRTTDLAASLDTAGSAEADASDAETGSKSPGSFLFSPLGAALAGTVCELALASDTDTSKEIVGSERCKRSSVALDGTAAVSADTSKHFFGPGRCKLFGAALNGTAATGADTSKVFCGPDRCKLLGAALNGTAAGGSDTSKESVGPDRRELFGAALNGTASGRVCVSILRATSRRRDDSYATQAPTATPPANQTTP